MAVVYRASGVGLRHRHSAKCFRWIGHQGSPQQAHGGSSLVQTKRRRGVLLARGGRILGARVEEVFIAENRGAGN